MLLLHVVASCIASDHVNADMPASPSSRLVPPSITSSRAWNFRCSRGKRIMLRGLEMLGTYVLGQSELKCRKKSEGLRSHDSDLRNGHVVVFSAMFHMWVWPPALQMMVPERLRQRFHHRKLPVTDTDAVGNFHRSNSQSQKLTIRAWFFPPLARRCMGTGWGKNPRWSSNLQLQKSINKRSRKYMRVYEKNARLQCRQKKCYEPTL